MLDAMGCMVKLVELYDNADILRKKNGAQPSPLEKGFWILTLF